MNCAVKAIFKDISLDTNRNCNGPVFTVMSSKLIASVINKQEYLVQFDLDTSNPTCLFIVNISFERLPSMLLWFWNDIV